MDEKELRAALLKLIQEKALKRGDFTLASGKKATFYLDGKKQFRIDGGLLFTHFGISGPLILNNAHKVADLLLNGDEVTALLDAYPDIDLGSLEQKILHVFEAAKNKSLKNAMRDFLPAGMQKGIAVLLSDHMYIETKVQSVSKAERKFIVQTLKALPMTIDGLMGFDRDFEKLRVTVELQEEHSSSALLAATEDRIRTVARIYAKAPTAMSIWTMGINQSTHGSDGVADINNLNLITGNIGIPGGTSLSITGQCNAMGTREWSSCSGLPGYRAAKWWIIR